MSDGLVEFVRQCVARDEQVARAAGADSLEWREDSSWLHDLRDPLPSQRRDHELAPGTKLVSDADAAHIARHDPARVLAEVESKRAILDEVQSWSHRYLDEDPFFSCSQAVAPGETEPGSGCADDERAGQPCDCGLGQRRAAILGPLGWRKERDAEATSR